MDFFVIPAHKAVTTEGKVIVWDNLTIKLIHLVHR